MKLNVFVSSQRDGIMSSDKKYFPTLSKEERKILYESTLARFFERRNIDYKNVKIIKEENNEIKARSATNTLLKGKEAILILKDTAKDVCVAVETSDYPVVIATASNNDNQSVSAIALGTIENINNNLLHEMIECLIKETNAAPFEMTFYIGACPSKEELIINPNQLTNALIWKNATIKKKKQLCLDLRYAIFNTLINEIVDPNNIYFDSSNTTTDEKYFSDIAGKIGKNLVCAVYTDEEV